MEEIIEKKSCDMVTACDLRNQGSEEESVICCSCFSIRQRYIFLSFAQKINIELDPDYLDRLFAAIYWRISSGCIYFFSLIFL